MNYLNKYLVAGMVTLFALSAQAQDGASKTVETKAAPKVEAKAAVKAEAKTTAKPEAKAEAKAATKPEAKVEAKAPVATNEEAAATEQAVAEEPVADSSAEAETQGMVETSAVELEDDEEMGDDSVVGRLGVGYFTTSAPVGIRRWASDKWGYDLGIGLGVQSKNSSHPETAWNANLEVGVLYALTHLENIIVFVRGGVGAGLDDNGGTNEDASFNMNLNATLGGEFFLTALGFPNLSLSGGIGASLGITKPDVGDTEVGFSTGSYGVNIVSSAAVAGMLGFHIYL
ncbi:MAG: hypothetical protein IPJ88_18310 [Myxococcales bacterium]|nr:MAG: hypothetical protein IPJ88_18310 [Myxococcales bacterium]